MNAPPHNPPGFAPRLNPGPAPDRTEWHATGFALSADGQQHAIAWAYEDASDPISGFSGAVDIWDVQTQTLRRTVEGISGGVCFPEGGSKGSVRWLPDGTLGLGFNTNAVGVLDLADSKLLFGVGDPTGTDSDRPWFRVDDDLWIVGFHADYRMLGSRFPLSIWRPSEGSLTAFSPEGQDESDEFGFASYGLLNGGKALGVRDDQIALLDPPRTSSVRTPQVARQLHLRPGLGRRPVASAQSFRDHVAPTGIWVVSDQADGLWLLGAELHAVRKLEPFDSALVPATFAWSPNGRYLAVSMRGPSGTDGDVRWWDVQEPDQRRTVSIAAHCERGASSGHGSYAQPIAVRNDGLLAVLQERTVAFVDPQSGHIKKTHPVRQGTIHLAFAVRGILVAAGEGFASFSNPDG